MTVNQQNLWWNFEFFTPMCQEQSEAVDFIFDIHLPVRASHQLTKSNLRTEQDYNSQ